MSQNVSKFIFVFFTVKREYVQQFKNFKLEKWIFVFDNSWQKVLLFQTLLAANRPKSLLISFANSDLNFARIHNLWNSSRCSLRFCCCFQILLRNRRRRLIGELTRNRMDLCRNIGLQLKKQNYEKGSSTSSRGEFNVSSWNRGMKSNKEKRAHRGCPESRPIASQAHEAG